MPARSKGTPIVLTASTIEMAHFQDDPFGAFAASFITIPGFMKSLIYRSRNNLDNNQAIIAPYGLRKVEAILRGTGLNESDIAVVHPSKLKHFIGPNTRAIGISTMDPLGLAYVSKTYSSIFAFGAAPSNRIEFYNLFYKTPIAAARHRWQSLIIVGGAGAWQVASKPMRNFFGIDIVFLGQAEGVVANIFQKALAGDHIPAIVKGGTPQSSNEIPLIQGGAVHGSVEVTRGCGRGCQFCSPTQRVRLSIPLDQVLAEVKINVQAGNEMITLGTEDLFLYGLNSSRFIPNHSKIVELVREVAAVPGVKYLQPAHIALAPVLASPPMVEEVAHYLLPKARYKRRGRPYVTAEAGVETGSIRLIRKYMSGKALPFKAEEWPDLVEQAIGILNDNDWYPLTTWIIGLPGEQEKDVLATLELLDRLKGAILFYVPLFLVALQPSRFGKLSQPGVTTLTEMQWEFFARAWEFNLDIWRRPLSIKSPAGLASTIGVPLGGGLLYLLNKRGTPSAPVMKRLIFHAFKKALFAPS